MSGLHEMFVQVRRTCLAHHSFVISDALFHPFLSFRLPLRQTTPLGRKKSPKFKEKLVSEAWSKEHQNGDLTSEFWIQFSKNKLCAIGKALHILNLNFPVYERGTLE